MELINDGKTLGCITAKEDAFALLSKDRIEILRLLAKEPLYTAQIAKQVNMPVQTLYYHVRLLEEAGFIEIAEYAERAGAVAKKYRARADALALILKEDWKVSIQTKKTAPSWISPFIKNGTFNGKLVLGSPDPHGKYRARGSELCSSELGMLIGNYATFDFPLYLLDTELKTQDRKQPLILAGGPKVNMIVSEINANLPIRFDETTFDIYSNLSKKRYGEDVGVIELIENPFSKKDPLLVIGGLTHGGTRAAVLALLKKSKEIGQGNVFDPSKICKVVQGFDENGDGVIDSVEVLE